MKEISTDLAGTMTDALLRKAVSYCHQNGLSFALWKLPSQSTYTFAASHEPRLIHDINLEDKATGFIFAPFDQGQKKVFLPADHLFSIDGNQINTLAGNLPELLSAVPRIERSQKIPYYTRKAGSPSATSDSQSFKKLVSMCRDAIHSGQLEKIVPSRSKTIEIPADFDLSSTCLGLGKRYPSAMVSVFSSPSTGTWLGATPEMLVRVDAQQHFHTVAVAGTQPFVPGTDIKQILWTQKEIEEQALVERYVISCFKKIRLREFEEHGPKTVVAGNVVHLKTEFEVDMVATRYPQLGSVMLQLLHPTSAVCGMPLEPSIAFLKEHEGYDREFYSGFLGPSNIHNETSLFVNLRCTQLLGDHALLYAGAGVLADSDPEKEWLETELKMNTLLDVIRR